VKEHRRDAAWHVGGVTKADNGKYKTKLCAQFYKGGNCKFGYKCDFAHGWADLRYALPLACSAKHPLLHEVGDAG
jgi:hypothetical protein